MRRALSLILIGSLAASAHADTVNHDRKGVLIADGIADGVALSSLVLTLGVRHTPKEATLTLFWGSLVAQVLAPPIVHAVGGDYGRAGIDLGTRVALPIGSFALGSFLCDKLSKRHDIEFLHCLGPGFIAGLLGIVGAQVIDWTLISQPTSQPPSMFKVGFAF